MAVRANVSIGNEPRAELGCLALGWLPIDTLGSGQFDLFLL
jgi:hypothetical protein